MRHMSRTIGLALVVAAASAGAQATARVSVGPTSKLWIEGTSNVHDWKCDATAIDAAIDIDAAVAQLSTGAPTLLRKVTVKVPVKSLKCGHGKMDDNLSKALKADGNSDINYVMTTFEATPGENADDFTLHMVGTLAIAGVQNAVTMNVAATRLPNGTIKVSGVLPVKMTAFGVKPPTAVFGTIKAGDEVKVRFEMSIGPKVIAAALDRP
jgi:polyisoprenoid-binding protein YceI